MSMFPQGVELGNLQFILDFMYNGEANVAEEELNSFLAVAEELKFKGLTQNQSKGKQESSSTAPLPKPAAPSCLPDEQPSTRRPPPTTVLQPKRHSVPLADYEPAQEFVSVKSEPCETSSIHQHQIDSTTTMQSIEGDYVAVEDYQDDDQYEGEGYNALQSGEVNGGKMYPLYSVEALILAVLLCQVLRTYFTAKYVPVPMSVKETLLHDNYVVCRV